MKLAENQQNIICTFLDEIVPAVTPSEDDANLQLPQFILKKENKEADYNQMILEGVDIKELKKDEHHVNLE